MMIFMTSGGFMFRLIADAESLLRRARAPLELTAFAQQAGAVFFEGLQP